MVEINSLYEKIRLPKFDLRAAKTWNKSAVHIETFTMNLSHNDVKCGRDRAVLFDWLGNNAEAIKFHVTSKLQQRIFRPFINSP